MKSEKKKHVMTCPYCHKDGVIPPFIGANRNNAHGYCPNCGLKPRASIEKVGDVWTVVKYGTEGKKRKDRGSVKEVYNIRLSKNDLRDVELGRAKIIPTGDGKRTLTLVFIPLL